MKFFERMLTVFLRPADPRLDQREAQVHEEHERRRQQHPDRVEPTVSSSAVFAMAWDGASRVTRTTPAAVSMTALLRRVLPKRP